MRLSQLEENERPREKLFNRGAGSLSVAELLAIVLRTGIKGQDVLEFSALLLNRLGGLEGLCRTCPAELMQEKGLKAGKAAALTAVIELGKRIAQLEEQNKDTWSSRIKSIARETRFADREQIYAIFLDARDRVIDEEMISYGGLSGAYMDIPVFYKKAVRVNACGVILVHNHPDGSHCASREDTALTGHIRQGLKILGMKFKGHYIAANGILTQVL